MSRGKKVIKIALTVTGGLIVMAGGVAAWANHAADARLDAVHETHRVTFAVPFPLTGKEVAKLRTTLADKQQRLAPPGPTLANAAEVEPTTSLNADTGAEPKSADANDEPAPQPTMQIDPLEGFDLEAEARRRAKARGKHLVDARYACTECHGADFGGGTMIDGMPVARLFGPNLTKGQGSVVKDYTMADWDRAVRHGVLRDGRPSAMPAEDYFAMSDEELSDIITYISTLPPVDRPSKPRELGPVGIMLMALGKIRLSAEEHVDHKAAHAEYPPRVAATVEFGKHLMHVCSGCHRPELNGGTIVGGDPSWPPAKNITLHDEGIAGWTYEDFVAALREGKSKDGTPLKAPMSQMMPYANNMKDVELEAMWKYLQTVPAAATGK